MSPERSRLSLSPAITHQLRAQIPDYNHIVQACPFVFMEQNNVVTRVLIGEAITPGIWKDAKK